MELTVSQLYQLIGDYLWPMFRMAGMLMTMVVFSTSLVPSKLRVILAGSFAIIVAPTLPPTPVADLMSVQAYLVTIQEFLIGVVIGFVSQLLFSTFIAGGQIIAMKSGLAFASMMDPINGVNLPVLAQFFLMLSTLVFLSMDGHLVMIQMLVLSFDSIPIGSNQLQHIDFLSVAQWARWVFVGGLMMGISAIFGILLVNISFGIVSKAAPQLNIFALGFPITIMGGLIIAWISMIDIVPHFTNQWLRAKGFICQVLYMSC